MKKKNSDDFEYDESGTGRETVVVEPDPLQQSRPSAQAPKAEEEVEHMREPVGEVTFKKVLHGYSPHEVNDYIVSRNSYHESTVRTYDSKLEKLRSEVASLNKERESLLSKLEFARTELEQVKAQPQESAEDKLKYAEIEKNLRLLISKNEALAAEVVSLRSQRAEDEVEIVKLKESAAELDQVRQQKSEYEDEISLLNSKIREKDGEIQRLSTIEREHSVLKDEAAELKRLYAAEQEKRGKAEEELHDKTKQLVQAGAEQEQLRKELSEFEIRQSILRQQLKKADTDITEIRDQSKRQAYSYANKSTEMEAEFTAKKLQLQKQMQVHQYHIKQVGLLIDELKKQFEDACASLDNAEMSE